MLTGKFWIEEKRVTRSMDMDDLTETIRHFTHPHLLKLVQLSSWWSFECYCCGSSLKYCRKTVMYACRELECNPQGVELIGRIPRDGAYLCVSCAELEESVERNALHPHHPPLKLRRSTNRFRGCSACYSHLSSNFSYQCEEEEKCDFEMHVTCAHSLKPTLSLPTHPHLLTLIVVGEQCMSHVLNCESCPSGIPLGNSTTFARCVPCNKNYHIWCPRVDYRLPELVMDVQRHPQHPLSLTWTDTYWSCAVCSKNKVDWHGIPVYACSDCNNFTTHLSCIFQSSIPCPFSNLVTNIVLPDLITKDGPVHENLICQRCKKCILKNGVPFYGCQYCRFFLHETCIRRAMVDNKDEQTLIFSYPGYDLQNDDPLVLVFSHGAKGSFCAGCSKNCIGFMFERREEKKEGRRFVLDLECMLVVSSLEVIGHDHPVTILSNSTNHFLRCILRCIRCFENFDITESSCRFPRTLPHGSHFHPLTLVPCLVENFGTAQFYCDVCEGKRDPKECIYYCDECKFEAHLACVKSEVLAMCANKPEDVKFVTLEEILLEEEAKKKKVKLRDVFRLEERLGLSHIHADKEIDDIFQTASKITWKNWVGENPSYNDEFLSKILYSDESFKLFIEELDSASTLEAARSTLECLRYMEVVRVGEYLVPFDFDEAIETMFDKYGDFGAKCTYSPEVKQYLFVGLCKALQSMCKIKVAHITKRSLVELWGWLAIGKAAGFEIQFALEILERVAYAYFGLEADKYADGKLTQVRKKIREVPEEVMKLERKLEKLNKELVVKKRELEEAITEEKVLREAAFRVKKSLLMRKCLTEIDDLVCYSFGELLLHPSEEV